MVQLIFSAFFSAYNGQHDDDVPTCHALNLMGARSVSPTRVNLLEDSTRALDPLREYAGVMRASDLLLSIGFHNTHRSTHFVLLLSASLGAAGGYCKSHSLAFMLMTYMTPKNERCTVLL